MGRGHIDVLIRLKNVQNCYRPFVLANLNMGESMNAKDPVDKPFLVVVVIATVIIATLGFIIYP